MSTTSTSATPPTSWSSRAATARRACSTRGTGSARVGHAPAWQPGPAGAASVPNEDSVITASRDRTARAPGRWTRAGPRASFAGHDRARHRSASSSRATGSRRRAEDGTVRDLGGAQLQPLLEPAGSTPAPHRPGIDPRATVTGSVVTLRHRRPRRDARGPPRRRALGRGLAGRLARRHGQQGQRRTGSGMLDGETVGAERALRHGLRRVLQSQRTTGSSRAVPRLRASGTPRTASGSSPPRRRHRGARRPRSRLRHASSSAAATAFAPTSARCAAV